MNKKEETTSVMKSAGIRFLKGTLAGLTAAVILQPLQVVKTSMQISPQSKEISRTTRSQSSHRRSVRPHGRKRMRHPQSMSFSKARTIDLQALQQEMVHHQEKAKRSQLSFR